LPIKPTHGIIYSGNRIYLLSILFGGIIMKLSAPKQIVFWIAAVIAIIALLMALNVLNISFISAVWVALIAFALLALGNILKGF
jgi:threonine/homoserine/homoserine lactone efflux protein